MKHFILISILCMLGFTGNIFAQTIHIPYSGVPVMRTLHLETKDVVIIDTTIKVGTRYNVEAVLNSLLSKKASLNFNPLSETSAREVRFIDRLTAANNPGSVSYTYAAPKPINVIFTVFP